MRALIVVRLSRVTEASTSVDRQIEICEAFCRDRGWEVAGVLSDTDVSGAVDPFDRKLRPELGGWLAGEGPEADVLVTYRADRLTRSVRHLQRLVHWAEDNRKLIVSATEPHFDMTSPFAAVILALIGTISEWELNAISERNASTRRRDRRLGKYTGSVPPWGYVPEKVDGVWRLVQDPEQVAVIREVVSRVLDGEPLQKIGFDLTERGVLTVKDRMRVARGEPAKGTEWSQTVLKRSLLSEAMLGYAVSGGLPVRDESGAPVVRSEPILSRDEFERVRVELGSRAPKVEKAPAQQSLLTGVLRCGVCGEPAYRFNGGRGGKIARYRCRSVSKSGVSCGNKSVGADGVDKTVEQLVVGLLGESQRRVKVWQPGSDHSAELAEINAELVELTGLVGSPAYRAGSPQRQALDARIAALASRQEQLEGEAVTPAGWEWQPTGELFGDWWAGLDKAGKCQWLRSMGVTVTFDRDGWAFDAPDFAVLLEGLEPAGTVVAFREALNRSDRLVFDRKGLIRDE